MTTSRLVLFLLCIALLGFGGKPGLRFGATGGVTGGGDPASFVETLLTDTTTTAVRLEQAYNHNAVEKTFYAEVVGTGAVTQTVTIYGARVANATDDEMVALTTPTALSGTTVAVNAAATSTAPYPYYYVTTENVTGTAATVLVEVFY